MPQKTISEYQAEREALGRANQQPNYVAPETPKRDPAGEIKSTIGSVSPDWIADAAGTGAKAYDSWNRMAGVKPENEIAGEFARGNWKSGLTNLAYGAPGWAAARELLKGPEASYLGGSKDALGANRSQYDLGVLGGQGQNLRGEGISTAGADLALGGADIGSRTAGAGLDLYGTGTALGASGIGSQNAALNQSLLTAGQNVGSMAQLQQQQANDIQARQMMAMAANARGGNQAAALRAAQAQGSANALDTSSGLAQLRLAEDQARQQRLLDAQQNAATQYGGQATLGYGTATQGLGAANTGAGQITDAAGTLGTIGAGVMGSGTTNTGNFLDAEVEANKAQLEADQKLQEAKQKNRQGWINKIGQGIASMSGGGGFGG